MQVDAPVRPVTAGASARNHGYSGRPKVETVESYPALSIVPADMNKLIAVGCVALWGCGVEFLPPTPVPYHRFGPSSMSSTAVDSRTGTGTGTGTGGGTGTNCSLSGTWTASTTAAGSNTFSVAIVRTSSQSIIQVDRSGSSPLVHILGDWTYDSTTSSITFTYTSATTTDTSFDTCLNIAGRYKVIFSGCSSFKLATESDSCSTRSSLLGTSALVFH